MTVVVVNTKSGGGRALKRWQNVQNLLENHIGSFHKIFVQDSLNVCSQLREFIEKGHRRFIAAGGDGTINHLLQDLISVTDKRSRSDIRIGAIGLGSSNDFHKPSAPERNIDGIPVKIDFNSAIPHDIGSIIFEDEDKITYKHYWLLNTSIGLTARANDFFNHPDIILGQLKHRAVNLAILYAALHTIFRNQTLEIKIKGSNNQTKFYTISNLSIVKTPHFSGNFCYDSPYSPNDGIFHVHLMHQMSLPKILFTLWSLSHKRFQNLSGTESWQSNSLSISSMLPFAIEIDGEVFNSRDVIFQIWDERINICNQ